MTQQLETITITCPHCGAPLTATFEVSRTRHYTFACDHCERASIVTVEVAPKAIGPSETK